MEKPHCGHSCTGRASASRLSTGAGWSASMSVSIVTTPDTVKPGPRPRIGVHLSLGLDPASSLARARNNGAECVQIFASSPGAWKPPVLDPPKVESFLHGRARTGISPAYIHAIYLINLASAD